MSPGLAGVRANGTHPPSTKVGERDGEVGEDRKREGNQPRSMITRLKMGDQTILAEETRGLDTANRVQRRGIGSELDETGPAVDVIVKETRKTRAVVRLGY